MSRFEPNDACEERRDISRDATFRDVIGWLTRTWHRLTAQGSLDKVRGPATVCVEGTVEGPNDQRSPFDDLDVAVLRWSLFRFRRMVQNSDRSPPYERIPIAAGLIGEVLRVRVGEDVVDVPLGGGKVELVFADDDPSGRPVDRALPPHLARMVETGPQDGGSVHFEQYTLRAGDRVRLTAVVERGDGGGGGGYRASSASRFRVRTDLGRASIEDEFVFRPPDL